MQFFTNDVLVSVRRLRKSRLPVELDLFFACRFDLNKTENKNFPFYISISPLEKKIIFNFFSY